MNLPPMSKNLSRMASVAPGVTIQPNALPPSPTGIETLDFHFQTLAISELLTVSMLSSIAAKPCCQGKL
ncbi:Uncharacterised protein [Mycobacteroides abscessus subsp. massiliense]|nr:Uncharacterised protein [Mycobacteroides abscessus subsp. abscessus]SLD26932.1 Uncharacterised protein [Mycobacteroides abscessus subsp. massiliense]SLI17923.1 Uncharacterised protein [Mycobacteroides abscessus subsp. massiliense]